MTPPRLLECLGTTEELTEVFSSAAVLAAMLAFERALARAQARLELIPQSAADAIERAAAPEAFDAAAIAREARQSASLAIPLVHALSARVRAIDACAAPYVHLGATSQDVTDSAMMLLLRRAQHVLAADHARLETSLRALSDAHAHTVMPARTLLQPALPTTFGYKAAAWYAPLHRGWRRLSDAFGEALLLQFGGVAGTLAAYGKQGPVLARALGEELDLPAGGAPWHTQRDRLAAVVAHCGIYTGALGKMARDVALLMQAEVGEAAEPGGGSSALPGKRNPSGCAIVLAAATRMPGLVAAYLAGMVQEHERAAGGWQAEWQTLPDAVQTTGSALAAAAAAIAGLTVFPDRMRANLGGREPAVGAAEEFRKRLLED